MDIVTVAILAALVIIIGVLIWLALALGNIKQEKQSIAESIEKVDSEVESIFTEEFREELRNRGRLHFDKIIKENAMFLEQDLRLTSAQLNKNMEQSLKKVLKEQFEHYQETIDKAKETAVATINRTQELIDNKRAEIEAELKEDMRQEKEKALAAFNKNLSQIVNKYLIEALGNHVDIGAQSNYVFKELEEHKDAIREEVLENI